MSSTASVQDDPPADKNTLPWRPELMLCATDILHGNVVGFTPRGLIEVPIGDAITRFDALVRMARPEPVFGLAHARLSRDERLSSMMAASGAFPVAFNTYPVNFIGQDDQQRSYVLADGGLADNLGLVTLFAAREDFAFSRWDDDGFGWGHFERFGSTFIIGSDASAISPVTVPRTWLDEAADAIDVIYRSGAGEGLVGKGEFTFPASLIISPAEVLLRPDLTVAAGAAQAPASGLLDLDFSDGPTWPTTDVCCGKALDTHTYSGVSYWRLDAAALAFIAEQAPAASGAELERVKAAVASVAARYAGLKGDDNEVAAQRFKSKTEADQLVYSL